MKGIIVYKSVLGTSRRYALWLAEDLKVWAEKSRNIKKDKLSKMDIVILVCGTYASRISLKKFIERNLDILAKKEVYFVNVGMVPEDDESTKLCWARLPQDFRKTTKMYKIAGKIGKMGEDMVKKSNLDRIIKDIGRK